VDARSVARLLLCTLLLGAFAPALEAQARKGKGKGKRPPAAAGKAKAGGGAGGGGSLLPGFDSAPQGKSPAGPKGKAAPNAKGKANAKPAPPPDPMKEADRISAEAEARRALESTEDKRLRELFLLCDLDHNGWISLREAELVLSFDRGEYRRADLDQDGRLVQKEFSAQRTLVFARLGAPPAPAAEPAVVEEPPPVASKPPESAASTPAPPAPPRTRRREVPALPGVFPRPSDLLQRYDRNTSQALDIEEVERLLTDLGLDLSAPLVVAQMDPDTSGELSAGELLPLSLLASKHLPESMRPTARARPEAPVERSAPPSSDTPEPAPARPSALAAMTPFGRLDRDHDGFISEQDLRSMEGLARLDARVGVLLSALDGDGDRRLSRDEFERAMQAAPQGAKPSDQ
jgi:Ca2+-binding EF-hand superfamily protein